MGFEHATVDTNVSSTLRVIFGVIGMSTSFLLMPFAVFYVYNFYRLRRSNILKKRYVELSVTSSVLFIIWTTTTIQFYLIQNCFNHLISPLSSTIFKALYVFVYPYTSHCSLWLILTRFWLSYFDFSWTKATLNAEWKVHIDPHEGSSHNEQWFLANKAKYGNLQIMRRKAWIISLCIATFSMLAFEVSVFTTFVTATQVQGIDFIFYICPFIALLVLWKRIPPVYDILFYRLEMQKLGCTCLVVLINYFSVIAVSLVFGDDVITSFYGGMSQLFYTYSLIFYQTAWVLYKIKNSNMNMGRTYNRENSHTVQSQTDTIPYAISMNSIFRMMSLGNSHTHKERDRAAMLPHILGHKQAFNLFMQHLSAEFSMECLLAFTEFTQFRMLLEQDFKFMEVIGISDDIRATEQQNTSGNTGNGNGAADLQLDHNKNVMIELEQDIVTNEFEEDEEDGIGHGTPDLQQIPTESAPTTPQPQNDYDKGVPTTPLAAPMTPMNNMTPMPMLDSNAITFSSIPDKDILRQKSSKLHPYKTVRLPKKIPQSYIVYGDREEKDGSNEKYLQIAIDLFKKYVKIGSEFEINVSYGMRYGVQRVIENSDVNGNIECDLYDLFESSRKEMYVLMTHSCQRFVDTDKYKNIENELRKQ